MNGAVVVRNVSQAIVPGALVPCEPDGSGWFSRRAVMPGDRRALLSAGLPRDAQRLATRRGAASLRVRRHFLD